MASLTRRERTSTLKTPAPASMPVDARAWEAGVGGAALRCRRSGASVRLFGLRFNRDGRPNPWVKLAMVPTHFRRYRMEIDLVALDLRWPRLPLEYSLFPWNPACLEAHGLVKYHSFRDEIDSSVFPCFNELAGCQRLMHDIAAKPGFLPRSTWLAAYVGPAGDRCDYCGTVQGVRDPAGLGAIQNLGITPEHRGRGLGTFLLFRALDGFREAGLVRAYLEVTADNTQAVHLYQRLGFCTAKTVYKVADVVYS
jgi:ribosomal protein S18 acetylase RimI-like enzyme